MCDSLTMSFKTDLLSNEEREKVNYPCNRRNSSDQDGEILLELSERITVTSPLTRAKFKVQAIYENNDIRKGAVVGYKVEINIPASTIGNNVLPNNMVCSASKLLRLLLQYWLLSKGCSVAATKAISLEHASLVSVTLTYLLPCKDHLDALAANQELFDCGEALKNRLSSKAKNPVFKFGGSTDFTAYFKGNGFQISSYVKSGPTEKAYASFPSKEVENGIYAEGEKLLRVEIKLGGKWLKDHNLDTSAAWKQNSGKNPYEMGMLVIRKYFRTDERLRTRRPRPSDLHTLSPRDQEILESHLAGNDVRQHIKDNQYFSAIKIRILKKLRIDITIPWKEQSTKISPRLADLLKYSNRYRLSPQLAQYSLCQDTVADRMARLVQMIRNKVALLKQPTQKRESLPQVSSVCTVAAQGNFLA
jgi:hypothetical protein